MAAWVVLEAAAAFLAAVARFAAVFFIPSINILSALSALTVLCVTFSAVIAAGIAAVEEVCSIMV
jgi:hypothetical protein